MNINLKGFTNEDKEDIYIGLFEKFNGNSKAFYIQEFMVKKVDERVPFFDEIYDIKDCYVENDLEETIKYIDESMIMTTQDLENLISEIIEERDISPIIDAVSRRIDFELEINKNKINIQTSFIYVIKENKEIYEDGGNTTYIKLNDKDITSYNDDNTRTIIDGLIRKIDEIYEDNLKNNNKFVLRNLKFTKEVLKDEILVKDLTKAIDNFDITKTYLLFSGKDKEVSFDDVKYEISKEAQGNSRVNVFEDIFIVNKDYDLPRVTLNPLESWSNAASGILAEELAVIAYGGDVGTSPELKRMTNDIKNIFKNGTEENYNNLKSSEESIGYVIDFMNNSGNSELFYTLNNSKGISEEDKITFEKYLNKSREITDKQFEFMDKVSEGNDNLRYLYLSEKFSKNHYASGNLNDEEIKEFKNLKELQDLYTFKNNSEMVFKYVGITDDKIKDRIINKLLDNKKDMYEPAEVKLKEFIKTLDDGDYTKTRAENTLKEGISEFSRINGIENLTEKLSSIKETEYMKSKDFNEIRVEKDNTKNIDGVCF